MDTCRLVAFFDLWGKPGVVTPQQAILDNHDALLTYARFLTRKGTNPSRRNYDHSFRYTQSSYEASSSSAEDLVQDCLVKVLLQWDGIQNPDSPAHVRRWMKTVLKNHWLTGITHQKVCAKHAAATLQELEGEPVTEQPSLEFRVVDDVLAAMAELDETFRSALLRHAVEEHTYVEIAADVGVPVGTVKSRVSRAAAAVRTALALGAEAP